MDKIEKYAGTIACALITLVLLILLANWLTPHPNASKPAPAPPIEPKIVGLELHKWYRPTAPDIGWSWDRQQWLRGEQRGRLEPRAPFYVTERAGNVAVCHGAIQGTILVPDCCAHLFALSHRTGETGDPPDEEP